MRTIDELGISKTPWSVGRIGVPRCIISYDNEIIATERVTEHGDANASLFAAAPELLAFAVSYYNANKKYAIKINADNGDMLQSGQMLMCKQALVKAGIMDESEVWKEEVK